MKKITQYALLSAALTGMFMSCGRGDLHHHKSRMLSDNKIAMGSHALEQQNFSYNTSEMEKVSEDMATVVEGPITDSITSEDEIPPEMWGKMIENPFVTSKDNPVSTFSIDVDNASYTSIRSTINYGSKPSPDQVRVEEMINYFDYNYTNPTGEHPFAIDLEAAPAPWNEAHQLVRIGIQGKKPDYSMVQQHSNLVFLIDVSGSMSDDIELIKVAIGKLVDGLDDNDNVAIVVYAGAAGLVLPATKASDKNKIMNAMNKLEAGGSTAGGAGIKLAYKIARENFIDGGNNRVILATDGDFNVGTTDNDELVALLEKGSQDNIFLTIAGFGMGGYNDDRMETLSNKGNGNYFYIDSEKEATRVFTRNMFANMFAIAKDVKIQLEFNANYVEAYRLIGYENRLLDYEDFDDDTKDAGELGAGHTVTAIYEIIPKGTGSKALIEEQFSVPEDFTSWVKNDELMGIKFRYKPVEADESILIQTGLAKNAVQTSFANSSENFRWATAVTGFGLLLRESNLAKDISYEMIHAIATDAMGKDEFGDRKEMIDLVTKVSDM